MKKRDGLKSNFNESLTNTKYTKKNIQKVLKDVMELEQIGVLIGIGGNFDRCMSSTMTFELL